MNCRELTTLQSIKIILWVAQAMASILHIQLSHQLEKHRSNSSPILVHYSSAVLTCRQMGQASLAFCWHPSLQPQGVKLLIITAMVEWADPMGLEEGGNRVSRACWACDLCCRPLRTWRMGAEDTGQRQWSREMPIQTQQWLYSGLILGLCPANERRCYFVTTSLIGWVKA